MRHLLVLGLLAVGPAAAHADDVPTTGVVLAPEQQQDDLLTSPSVQTRGAQRLGGTEIVNPPHDSFGMMQSPDNPSRGNLREERTGAPRVSGPQARRNAAELKELRRDTAAEAAGIEATSPQEIAFQEANAQAAGTQAAISAAVTSQNASAAGTAPLPSESQPALPDQSGAPVDRGSDPSGAAPSPSPSPSPSDDGAPSQGAPSTAPNPSSTKPDILPPDATTPDATTPGTSNPIDGTTPPAGPSGSPSDATPPAGGAPSDSNTR